LTDTKLAREREKTDVIEESIRPYAIAEKLRSLRQRKSMGLAQLAAHTGLSAAMPSKLENARLLPTLPTLVRIATVFNVGLDYFFTDSRKRHVVAISRKTRGYGFRSNGGKNRRWPHIRSVNRIGCRTVILKWP